MLHLEVLRTHEGVSLSLVDAESSHGDLDVFRQGVVNGQVVVSHYHSVSVAVVIDNDIKDELILFVVNFHFISVIIVNRHQM